MKLKYRVRIEQYAGIVLLAFTGWAYSTHWVLGTIFLVYGFWITVLAYKHFKEFLRDKWKIKA